MNNDDREYRSSARRWIIFLISLMIVLSIVATLGGYWNKIFNADRAVDTYEHFYVLYEQADQICNDLAVIEMADSVSGGFTKTERKIALENKLNEVIQEYNSKSDAWTRNMWKADDLPYKLKRSDFSCN